MDRSRAGSGTGTWQQEEAKRALTVQLYRAKEHTILEICQMVGVSKPTIYAYVEEAKQ